MTVAPELDTETGEVVLAEPALTVLVNHATERDLPVPPETDTREQLELLRSAAVLDEAGRAHPLVARGLAALANPEICTLELAYSGRSMLGWAGHRTAALLLPPYDDGRRKLAPLPRSLLPDALGRLANLGERPRPQPAQPVPYHEGAFTDPRRHWQLSVARPAHNGGATGTRVILEVIDTPGGLWVLQPGEQGDPVAWPSTPTMVLRSMVGLVTPRDAEQPA